MCGEPRTERRSMYHLQPYLEEIDRVIEQGPYTDTWESLSAYEPPKWYRDGKFGIFIHWGIYSVPAFGNEWYSRNMYIQGSKEYEHHTAVYGKHESFGYKDFIPLFTADRFDAAAWADLFTEAGAAYVVPVAEHHDGFMMYRSEISRWNAWEMGPKRDVLGELTKECQKRGMVNGASSHRAEHWFFMGHGREFDSDIKEPMERGDFYWPAMPEPDHHDIYGKPEPTKEYLNDWLVRTCEIIDRYQPKVLYFDWWIQHSSFKPYLRKLAAYYYNRGERPVCRCKAVFLADRHGHCVKFLVLHGKQRVPPGGGYYLRPDRHCQQKRLSLAECGAEGRRDHIPGGQKRAPRNRKMAEGQRRGGIRQQSLEKIRRRSHKGGGGPVYRQNQKAFYPEGFPVYDGQWLLIRCRPGVQ